MSVGAGVVSSFTLISALVEWVLQIRKIDRELATSELKDDSTGFEKALLKKRGQDRRTKALFTLIRAVAYSVFFREITILGALLLMEPARTVLELPWYSIACRTASIVGLGLLVYFVDMGESVYGEEEFFEWWIGTMAGPLDLFEKVHICGTHVASMFYHTARSVSN